MPNVDPSRPAAWRRYESAGAYGLSVLLLAWVARDALVALQFSVFLVTFVLPALAVMSAYFARVLGTRTLAVFLSFHTLVLSLVPLYLLRKSLAPWGEALDALLIIALLSASRRREVRDFVGRWAAENSIRRIGPLALLGVALIFSTLWLGFETQEGEVVWYAGQFGIDFGNLSNVVTLLRISPSTPLNEVAGVGALNYHWFFFALPAYFCDFAGWDIRSTEGLVLCNAFMAWIFYLWLLEAASLLVPNGVSEKVRHATALVVVFASNINYSTDTISSLLPYDVLATLARNHLILSPINSMANFANNTLAVGAILALPSLIGHWNRHRQPLTAFLGISVFLSMIGLSVTLFFSTFLALLVWTLAGRIHALWKIMVFASISGLAAAAAYDALEVVGSARSGLAIKFDGGRFLLRTLLTHTPLLFLAAIGAAKSPALDLYRVIWLSALAVPSWLLVRPNDFSMKNGTLMAVILTPLVGRAIAWLHEEPRKRRSIGVLALALCGLGLLNASAYIGQFPAYRILQTEFRGNLGFSIPVDYWNVLRCLRESSPRSSVVWDFAIPETTRVSTALLVGERRSYFPQRDSGLETAREAIELRMETWHAIQAGQSNPKEILDDGAWDYAILEDSAPWTPSNARRVCRFGSMNLYTREEAE